MEARDDDWAPWVSDMVACVPTFAWIPTELWDGSKVWLRRVYRINNRNNVWYSLTVPRNAL
jgi:hypothetical protein